MRAEATVRTQELSGDDAVASVSFFRDVLPTRFSRLPVVIIPVANSQREPPFQSRGRGVGMIPSSRRLHPSAFRRRKKSCSRSTPGHSSGNSRPIRN